MLHGGYWQTTAPAWFGISESDSWEKSHEAFYETFHFPWKQMVGWSRREFVTTFPRVARMLWGRDHPDGSIQRMHAAHPMCAQHADACTECMDHISLGGNAYWRCSYLCCDWDATSWACSICKGYNVWMPYCAALRNIQSSAWLSFGSRKSIWTPGKPHSMRLDQCSVYLHLHSAKIRTNLRRLYDPITYGAFGSCYTHRLPMQGQFTIAGSLLRWLHIWDNRFGYDGDLRTFHICYIKERCEKEGW